MRKQINSALTLVVVLLLTNVMLDSKGTGPNYVLLKMQMDSLSRKATIYSMHYSMQYQQMKLKLAKLSG